MTLELIQMLNAIRLEIRGMTVMHAQLAAITHGTTKENVSATVTRQIEMRDGADHLAELAIDSARFKENAGL